jgi:hypothetical protein
MPLPVDMLYVMGSARSRGYKIGHGDPAKRIKGHRTAQPDIEFIAAVAHPSPDAVERRILDHFRAHSLGGEWIDRDSAVISWIERFAASPAVATQLGELERSWWPGDSIMPWSGPPDLVQEEGQGVLPIDQGPYVRHRSSHRGQSSAHSRDWFMPPKYIEAIREVFGGTIDLDPLSEREANNYVKAERIYTPETDGLAHSWHGKILLNPPWGGVGPESVKRRAIVKLLDGYRRGDIEAAIVSLNANSTTTSWFAPLLSFHICFPNHRVMHSGPEGHLGAPNAGTVFVYLGPDPARFAGVFREFGAIMAPLANAFPAHAEDWDPDEEVPATTS